VVMPDDPFVSSTNSGNCFVKMSNDVIVANNTASRRVDDCGSGGGV
jgi:hypothetical protein